jgi:DNA adenine methylase
MTQLSFLIEDAKITNVASVPQRSLFRYPGGKTWLIPHIRQWFEQSYIKPRKFIEPFAGGGIVGLTVAFERLAEQVVLVEKDPQVAAVWQTILENEAHWLAERITSFELTEESLNLELSTPPATLKEKAFQTILLNRVNRGGILAAGAGRIKSGENGKGLLSRWYPETLKRRILEIITIRDKITFIEGDAIAVLKAMKTQKESVAFFLDPPYTAAGKKAGSRLYTYSQIDHEQLFQIASTLGKNVLMTYDDSPEIRGLAQNYGFEVEPIVMKSTHHTKMRELLISPNLDWAR